MNSVSGQKAALAAPAKNNGWMIWVGGFVGIMLCNMVAAFVITHKPSGPPAASEADILADHLTKPGLSHDEVTEWVEGFIPLTTEFDSREFYNQIASLEPWFTKEGWKFYRGMLDRYKFIKLLRSGAFKITPRIDAPLEFLEEGVDKKAYYWKVKLKMTLIMRSDSKRLDLPLAAHVRLVRVPVAFRDDGVAVGSLNFLQTGPAIPVPLE